MGNEGKFILRLTDVRNETASDPATDVIFFSGHGTSSTVGGGRDLKLPPSKRFTLPAFPQSNFLHGHLVPTRYRPRTIGGFRLTHGEVIERNLNVIRKPDEWDASFVRWSNLPQQCRRLKKVPRELSKSQSAGRHTLRLVHQRHV